MIDFLNFFVFASILKTICHFSFYMCEFPVCVFWTFFYWTLVIFKRICNIQLWKGLKWSESPEKSIFPKICMLDFEEVKFNTGTTFQLQFLNSFVFTVCSTWGFLLPPACEIHQPILILHLIWSLSATFSSTKTASSFLTREMSLFLPSY